MSAIVIRLRISNFMQANISKKADDPKAKTYIPVSRLLARLGRKLHPILGDGNCFFRALSYIMYGTEDRHTSVRASLVLFSELNAESFKKYCTSFCCVVSAEFKGTRTTRAMP